MSQLIEKKKDNLPKKSIAITFDDGYEDNFYKCFSYFKKYNVKATIYIVVDRHDRNGHQKKKKIVVES